MPADEMFESQLRSRGDLAGVFEFGGEVVYFYRYSTIRLGKRKIRGAIHILSGAPDFREDDIAICWDQAESKVGLRIRESFGQLLILKLEQHMAATIMSMAGLPFRHR